MRRPSLALGVRLRPAWSRRVAVLRQRAGAGGARRGGAPLGLLLAGATVAAAATPALHHAGSARPLAHPTDPPSTHRSLASFVRQEASAPLDLAPAVSVPAPPPPQVAAAPLRKHEIFGFAPYWTLDLAPGFDLRSLSTIAYFGLDIAPNGSLLTSGDGWTGYSSEALASLITRAHGAGDRVVLSTEIFDNDDIHRLVTSPGAADRLATQLIADIRAKNMDGANIDVEGTGDRDRAAYAAFVTRVAQTLHAANPHWQVTVDTYASSAADSQGFFDVAAIAPAVDAIFVMAYDMYADGQAGPNAPLDNYTQNDTTAMAAYTAVAPSAKVLLGTPFYGYDWKTGDSKPNAPTSDTPQPLTYSAILAAGHTVQWDTRGSVPFAAYKGPDGAWHQTWFDNAQSLALKAQLVNRYRLRGVGVWALGMDGNDPTMMAALLGHAAPLKLGPAGTLVTPKPTATKPPPTSSSTTAAPTATHSSTPASTPPPSASPTPSPSPSDSSIAAPTVSPPPADQPTPPPLPTVSF